MSDGPHKSMQLPRYLKKLVKKAHNQAYSSEDIASELIQALVKKMNQVLTPHLEHLRNVLLQSENDMFAEPHTCIDQLRERMSGEMPHLFLDHASLACMEGKCTQHVLDEALQNTAKEMASRTSRQIEEILRRDGYQQHISNIRVRLSSATKGAEFQSIQFENGKIKIRDIAKVSRMSGIEDGPDL